MLDEAFKDFVDLLRDGKIEIYNESSLQHELGFYLRNTLHNVASIQFERPVDYFRLNRQNFVKREIDISITWSDNTTGAIELKYPRSGQYPEQMFKACQDILFLEQLVQAGFSPSAFLMIVDDPLFYRGPTLNGIYSYFRGTEPIAGVISKPTGREMIQLPFSNSYDVRWRTIVGELKCACVYVN